MSSSDESPLLKPNVAQRRRPLWAEASIVVVVAFVAMASMLPYIGIAKLLDIDMTKLSGVQFRFQWGPVLFFFLYGATVVAIIATAQKYIHHRSLLDLGFRPGFLLPLTLGTLVGFATKTVWLSILLASSEDVSFTYSIPSDVSWLSYSLHYLYFVVGFIALNSFIEELATRAYPFATLCDRISPVVLAFVSSLVFTVGHFIVNEFSRPYAMALMLAGLLFALVYFKTNSLWAVVGLHNGMNWFTFTFYGSSWKMGLIFEAKITGVPLWIDHYSSSMAYLVAIAFVFALSKLVSAPEVEQTACPES